MHIHDFRSAARVLGKKEATDILQLLSRRAWVKASEAARELGIHTATAVKYLSSLAELGYVRTRKAKGKTREVVEYRLSSKTITLSVDLDSRTPSGDLEIYIFVLDRLMNKVNKISGDQVEKAVRKRFVALAKQHGLATGIDAISEVDTDAVSGIPKNKQFQFMIKTIELFISGAERSLGKTTTAALVESVMAVAVKKYSGRVNKAFDALPRDYFGE